MDLNYNIHNLIRLKSNFSVAPPCFLKRSVKYADMEIYRDSKPEVNLSDLNPLGLRLFYNENIFVHKCLFFLDAHLEIKEIGRRIILRFNRAYDFFRNPLSYFLAFLQMKLLDKGFSFIHASAVARNNECIIFPAFSDTGKTTTALSFLKDGYDFLGDDKVITDGQNVFSYPMPVRKVLSRPFETVPLLRRIKTRKTIYPPIAEAGIPRKIFFLSIRNKNEIREIDKQDIAEKISIMTESACPLFPYPTGTMLGYYFIRNIEFNRYIEARKKIILQLVDNCRTFLVTAKTGFEFYNLIKSRNDGLQD
ncbi:hypothetical protein GTO27_04545 [Candidatus Bathyarchaeota archaeon]|nr:hypothetical protein [Candidatus Bathyarchaeota archaeon]